MPDPTARDDELDLADLADLPDERASDPPPALAEEDGGGPEHPRPPPRSVALRLAAVAAVALLAAAALLVYRAQHRRKVVAAGVAKAEALLRLDTAAGYREAAALLEPISALDPIDAASLRAFALAMLVADYRGSESAEVDALLVAPGRSDRVPAYAQLAAAAVALGRREAGTATTALARADGGPWALALQARVALLAGNVPAALQPAAGAAAHGSFAPGLAVHGDVLRRLGKDAAGARAAYEAALSASPLHPRSIYGLAKLALSGAAPAAQAERGLERLLADRTGTPAPERTRAALHLASLRLRGRDRAGAATALDAAGLDPSARAWAELAAATAAGQAGRYRAVLGAPEALRSRSDDDPGEIAARPPAAPSAKKAPPKKRPTAKAGAAKTTRPKKAAPHRAATAASKRGTAKATSAATARPGAKRPAASAAPTRR